MKIHLDQKRFQSISNTGNGEVSSQTIFHYYQKDHIVWAEYSGGDIIRGTLLGKMVDENHLEMVYQHINTQNELMTGKCHSYFSINEQGKIQAKEYWQWTCKDNSQGESTLIEI